MGGALARGGARAAGRTSCSPTAAAWPASRWRRRSTPLCRWCWTWSTSTRPNGPRWPRAAAYFPMSWISTPANTARSPPSNWPRRSAPRFTALGRQRARALDPGCFRPGAGGRRAGAGALKRRRRGPSSALRTGARRRPAGTSSSPASWTTRRTSRRRCGWRASVWPAGQTGVRPDARLRIVGCQPRAGWVTPGRWPSRRLTSLAPWRTRVPTCGTPAVGRGAAADRARHPEQGARGGRRRPAVVPTPAVAEGLPAEVMPACRVGGDACGLCRGRAGQLPARSLPPTARARDGRCRPARTARVERAPGAAQSHPDRGGFRRPAEGSEQPAEESRRPRQAQNQHRTTASHWPGLAARAPAAARRPPGGGRVHHPPRRRRGRVGRVRVSAGCASRRTAAARPAGRACVSDGREGADGVRRRAARSRKRSRSAPEACSAARSKTSLLRMSCAAHVSVGNSRISGGPDTGARGRPSTGRSAAARPGRSRTRVQCPHSAV